MVGRDSEVVILNSENENPYQPIFKARKFDSLYKLECLIRISTTSKNRLSTPEKGLQNRGSRAPQDPPLAMPLTWLLGDMEFLLSCATRYLTRSLRSLVRLGVDFKRTRSFRHEACAIKVFNLLLLLLLLLLVEHWKRNSVPPCTHVLFSVYQSDS